MLQSDFSHGWTSLQTHRFFRIEANMGITQDSYTFSIDGIRFIDMPKKPVGGFKKSEHNNSRYGSGDFGSSSSSSSAPARRASTGGISNSNTQHNNSKSPPDEKHLKSTPSGNNFDPFADNGASSNFDPFAADTATNKNNKQSTPAVSLFDEIDSTPTTNSKNNFDPFAANHDPFSSQPAAAVTKPKNDGFDNFDPFASPSAAPSSSSSSNFNNFPAPTAQPHSKSQATSPATDLFAFDQPVATANNSASKPQRRASAQEISMDFAGLSFAAETHKKEAPAPQPVSQPAAPEPVQEKKEVPVDPWATNLVDLDLSGKGQAQRRPSTLSNTGPSLDNLMGSTNAQRRSSMSSGNNLSNNDILSSYQSSNDPFGAPSGVMRPAPTPISAMGMQPMVGPNGYAMAPAPMPPQNVRGSINMGQPMMMQPPMQPMGGQMNGGMQMNPRASFTSNVPLTNSMGYAAQQPAKNSLDTLDWKTM